MQKKYLLGSLIILVGIVLVWKFAAASQTWTGPESGCYDPSQTGCNADGVVWSRPDFNTAEVQTGNYKLSGKAEIGNDFRVGGDLFFINNSKALRVDANNVPGILNIGNWNPDNISQYPVDVNVYGDLTTVPVANNLHPKITGYSVEGTNNLCINGDCRTSWPAGGGGGGDVTDVLFSAPITVSNSAGPQPSVGLTACGAGQIYKMSGGVWTCSTDADTNSGGTISNISSSNNSISITNASGPNTVLSANNVYFDDRYVNVSGDTMSGSLTVQGNIDGQLGNRFGYSYTLGNWLMSAQPSADTIYTNGTISHTGAINSTGNITVTGAGQVKASALCIGNDCRAAWPAGGGSGDITDVLAGTGLTGGGTSGSVTLSIDPKYQTAQGCSVGQLTAWNGSSWVCTSYPVETGDVQSVIASTGIDVITPQGPVPEVSVKQTYRLPQACANGQIPVWNNPSQFWACGSDTFNSGDITEVIAGNGLTAGGATGPVTVHVGAGTGITVAADTVGVDFANLNSLYIMDKIGGRTCTAYSIGATQQITCPAGQYIASITKAVGVVSGIQCCTLDD